MIGIEDIPGRMGDRHSLPRGVNVFWLAMTVLTSVGSVAYLVTARSGGRFGISEQRRRKFHGSGILMIGWAAVCYGHLIAAA